MKQTLLGGLLGVPLLLAACAQGAPTWTAADAPPVSNAAPVTTEARTTRSNEGAAAGLSRVQSAMTPAPDFSVETVDGQRFRLADHRGEIVVVGFIANGCASCQSHIQALARIDQQYRNKGVQVLILDVDPSDTPAAVLAFKQLTRGGDHPWAIDSDGAVSTAYNVRVLEMAAIIDRDGRLAYLGVVRTEDAVKQQIDKLL